MCDCDLPSAYTKTMRRARKRHACCECGNVILPTQEYEFFSGVWDGRGMSFKTCNRCVGIRNWYIAECLPPGECRPCFGDLVQDATDYGNVGTLADLASEAAKAGYL